MSHSDFKEQKTSTEAPTLITGFSVEATDNLSKKMSRSTAIQNFFSKEQSRPVFSLSKEFVFYRSKAGYSTLRKKTRNRKLHFFLMTENKKNGAP
jgi:hypothetical protein